MGTIGDGTGTGYPGSIDSAETRSDGDVITANFQNDIQAVAIAVQPVLGTDPQGTYPSVVARLNAIQPFSIVSTTQTTLTAGVGVEQDMMTLSVPGGTLLVGDALDFSFDGELENVAGNNLNFFIRLGATNYLTFPVTHSQITAGWAYIIQGRLTLRSTTVAILNATVVYEQSNIVGTSQTILVDLATVSSFNGTTAFDLTFRANRDNATIGMVVETGYVRRISATT